MPIADRSAQHRRQFVWVGWWLISTLAALLVTAALFDLGVVLVLPVIAVVSGAAWLIVAGRGLRAGWSNRRQIARAVSLGCPAFLAVGVAWLVAPLVIRLGDYVQADAVLIANRAGYDRDVRRAMAGGRLTRPVMWSYGGFLSIERTIVFWPEGYPDRPLRAQLGRDVGTSCQWLRSSFYDCTISF